MSKLNVILVIVVLAFGLFITTLGSGFMQGLQSVYLSVVGPFMNTGSVVQDQLGAMGQELKAADQLNAENKQLRQENHELRALNQTLRDLEAENNRLRLALGYLERSPMRLLPARIIARDASTWWNTVMINRGFEHGVESDQTVLTDGGLVGKTTTVGKDTSIVILITDENCKVAASIEGTREKGILSGLRIKTSEAGECQLNFLSKHAAVEPGMKVYTAGVSGGVFPSGIYIGDVKSFRQRELDGQAVVAPAVDLSSIEDVFIVMGAK